MKATDPLSISQLEQRLDELQDWADGVEPGDPIPQRLLDRIQELRKAIERKIRENTFNKGIINPLPPDHIDSSNPYVVTPKAPSQVEREMTDWEKGLDR